MYPDNMTNTEPPRRQGENTAMQECDARAVFGRCTFPHAMVYTPMQTFGDIYDPESALHTGTIFHDLNLPFHGMSVAKGGNV